MTTRGSGIVVAGQGSGKAICSILSSQMVEACAPLGRVLMRAGLMLPTLLVLSAIVHVVLLTAVAVPRQQVTSHGETMTVDLVPSDEVPDSVNTEPQPETAPSPMGQVPSPPTPQIPDPSILNQTPQTPAQSPPAQRRDAQQPVQRQSQRSPPQTPTPPAQAAQPQPPPPPPPPQQQQQQQQQTVPQPPQPMARAPSEALESAAKIEPDTLAAQAERLSAMLNLPGPGFGDGSGATEAVDKAKLTKDEVAAFRSHLKSCWKLPTGVNADQRLKVIVRLSLRPNGSLASEPALIEAGLSPIGPPLVKEAMRAIRQCEPYSMLPAEKYKEWRVLDIDFSPDQMSNG
jgi:hypothetical protein